ncbi:MAG: hypothetical protein K6B73_05890, partial [Treponema sp.]|nr:hypothetical protein [Treponema sp.]
AYVHTDSAFATVNPLLDLHATEVLLSSGEFVKYRKMFMTLRSSPLRSNPLFKFLLSRPVDFASYGEVQNASFVASVNLGPFSFASRLVDFGWKYLLKYKSGFSLPDIKYVEDESLPYFCCTVDGNVFYVKALKNLVIVSDSKDLFMTSCLVKNDSTYTESQRKMLTQKSGGDIRIVADAKFLMQYFTEGNEVLSSMSHILGQDELSVLSLSITDSDLLVKCSLPVSEDEADLKKFNSIISKNSTVPAFLPALTDCVQYYTLLNAGSIDVLKDALLPFMNSGKSPEELWAQYDSMCKSMLGMNLNEFLLSWTGDEFAVLGIENQNDPVFAVRVKDEKARKKVFDKLTGSLLISEDDSLILAGVRLPRLTLPPFLNWMLSVVNISIPSPYFMVQNETIYFSESAESLSAIYTGALNGTALTKDDGWKSVSSRQKNESTMSLYYNLERSVPFFIKKNEAFSKVLSLYNLGRFDIRLRDYQLEFTLQAGARENRQSSGIPGFPLSLDGRADPKTFASNAAKNPDHVFYVKDDKTICSFDLQSTKTQTADSALGVMICSANASVSGSEGPALWSVTPLGVVSLMNSNLEELEPFPIMTGERVSVKPFVSDKNLIVISEEGSIFTFKTDGTYSTQKIAGLSVKMTPQNSGSNFALYSKGFLGHVFFFENGVVKNQDAPVTVNGISLSSPVMLKDSKNQAGFVTQAGDFYCWNFSKDADLVNPVKLKGVFMGPLASSQKYYYTISSDAVLYRISTDGDVLSVRIPHSTAKNAYLSVQKRTGAKYGVYVCADSNVIYGFDENLELLRGYPVKGFGYPVFADINADKKTDGIALTIDNKITAWRLK